MSHHFDTPTAREDPRINICDFYLFDGAPGTTVMALTVNPDAGLSAPDFFREEGLYAFRFDLDGDAREELTFKLRFETVQHGAQNEHRHVQSFEVRRSVGALVHRGWMATSSQAGEPARRSTPPPVFGSLPVCRRPVRGRWRCAGTFPYCGVPGQPVRSRCLSQSQEPVRAPQCQRYRARSPNADDWQRARAVLGHGVASRPRTGSSSVALGLTPDNTCIHAR